MTASTIISPTDSMVCDDDDVVVYTINSIATLTVVEMHCQHGGERAGEKAGENNSSRNI